jgi:nucleotidyltransferase substrate binding protein (TIGR01987 family)
MNNDINYQLSNFSHSLQRLHDVMQRDINEDSIVLDAAIQRFEFTFENAWKAIKMILKFYGEDATSPREAIKKAFRMGYVDNEAVFLELLHARNLTSHTYNYPIAISVYENVKKNMIVFDELYKKLQSLV